MMSDFDWIMTRSNATDGQKGLARTIMALPNHRRAIEDLACQLSGIRPRTVTGV